MKAHLAIVLAVFLAAGCATTDTPNSRTMTVNKRYLNVPVTVSAERARGQMVLIVDGTAEQKCVVDIAAEDPHTWFFIDMNEFIGKKMTVEVSGQDAAGLKDIYLSDTPKKLEGAYKEKYRPQFHFTPERGWTNDPNGLVFYKGEYHLFFQHNPFGTQWGNMTWGHAVSPDLVHWTEIGDAINPDPLGTIYSGSAVVDKRNSAGFKTGKEKPLVVFYTSAGSHAAAKVPFTQSIAYSNDRGRTWAKYEDNPVLGHIVGGNRDPKVIWHQPTKRWVMALYLEKDKYALFTSKDLKQWDHSCDVPMPGVNECPDIFELPVDGDPNNKKWVFWGGNGKYVIGEFDGVTFKSETEPMKTEWGTNCYAAQTYSDIPGSDGRRILIGWMKVKNDNAVNEPVYKDMPFNQQMSFPRTLTLRSTDEGVRLYMEPVQEIELIHGNKHVWTDEHIDPYSDSSSSFGHQLFDLRADIEIGEATELELDLRGTLVTYNVEKQELSCRGKKIPLKPENGRIKLQALIDTTSLEIFAADGRYVMSFALRTLPENTTLGITAKGGSARIQKIEAIELKPTPPKTKRP